MILLEGRIIKASGGFYYVSDSNNRVITCKVRGRFKREGLTPLVGDLVTITLLNEQKGIIEKIHPRRVLLERPPIANVNQIVVLFAVKNPDLDLGLLDRLLVLSEHKGLHAIVCFNKLDLIEKSEILPVRDIYRNINYPVILTSAVLGMGIDELREHLKGKISVFAGPSGVGKSTLLNNLQPGLRFKTGDISAKLKRGRHVTRHVELVSLSSGGMVADVPGFTRLDLKEIEESILDELFPEMARQKGKCKFRSCYHESEPGCAIKEALQSGKIAPSRYHNYLFFLKELREVAKR